MSKNIGPIKRLQINAHLSAKTVLFDECFNLQPKLNEKHFVYYPFSGNLYYTFQFIDEGGGLNIQYYEVPDSEEFKTLVTLFLSDIE